MPDINCPKCKKRLGEETEAGMIVHRKSVNQNSSFSCGTTDWMSFGCGGRGGTACDYRGVWTSGEGWTFSITNSLLDSDSIEALYHG